MAEFIKCLDHFRIKLDDRVSKLDEAGKLAFVDAVTAGDAPTRGLLVTFDLSHSGKRINNRIYSPAGQRDNVDSWTTPYEKPILVNHDDKRDPIGRFLDVAWVSTEAEAIEYIGSISDYLEVKSAFDSNSPKLIYRAMKKHGLLTDKAWPGMGKLQAVARITDPDAIKKFLDQRYLTFSAGTHTNAMSCMVCGSPWHKGEICEHMPGARDEDGEIGTFLTGGFFGDEGSVVNMPADVLSKVKHMQFTDSVDTKTIPTGCLDVDTEYFYITDSTLTFNDSKEQLKMETVELTDDQRLEQLQNLDDKTVAKAIWGSKLGFDLADALKGSSHFEIAWLIRVHDALHHEYDWNVQASSEMERELDMPTDVLRLHADIHELSTAKDFRGSLLNGALDRYDAKGNETNEFALKSKDNAEETDMKNPTDSKTDETPTQDVAPTGEADKAEDGAGATDVDESAKQTDDKADATDAEAKNTDAEADKSATTEGDSETPATDSKEDKGEDATGCENLTDLEDVDWYLLDKALDAEVGQEASLSAEEREKLDPDTFCGPERSFPVSDSAHVTAAKRLIGLAKVSDASKNKILAWVDERAKALGCDSNADNEKQKLLIDSLTVERDNLTSDLAEALKTVDSLKEKLALVLGSHATLRGEDMSTVDEADKLSTLMDWFDSIGTKDTTKKIVTVDDLEAVDNPGETSSEGKALKRKLADLSDFEQEFVNKFNRIRDEKGAEFADGYYRSQKKYLPRSFDTNLLRT